MRSQISYCDFICIHAKDLSGKKSPYKHICAGSFHSLWHYLVTISCGYNQHRLNCVMKKGIRHTEQTVEHTWERCRWARKDGPSLVLRGKEEFLHLANTPWCICDAGLCCALELRWRLIEQVENVCLLPPATVTGLLLSGWRTYWLEWALSVREAPKIGSDVARQTICLELQVVPFSVELLITKARWRTGCPPRNFGSSLPGAIMFPLALDASHTLQVLWEQHLLLFLAGFGV